VLFAGPASAHTGSITFNCANNGPPGTNARVDFFYSGFPAGSNSATENATVNSNHLVNNRVFNFTGTAGTDTVFITVPGGVPLGVNATSTWTVDNGGAAPPLTQVVPGGCPPPSQPPCPPGTSIHVRWHYSAKPNAGSGAGSSWSGTTGFSCPGPVSMGPQAMEGNLQVAPNGTLKAGFDFTIPGDNNPVTVTFTNPEVTFNVKCTNGQTPTSSTVVVPLGTQTYTSTNGGNWYPSGDQASSLVYQGSITLPDLCNGGNVSFQNGGTFTAMIS
jgi:hypothetical protein